MTPQIPEPGKKTPALHTLHQRFHHYRMIGLAFLFTAGLCLLLPFFTPREGAASPPPVDFSPLPHNSDDRPENGGPPNGSGGEAFSDLSSVSSAHMDSDAEPLPSSVSSDVSMGSSENCPSDGENSSEAISGRASDSAHSGMDSGRSSGTQIDDNPPMPPPPASDGVTLQEGIAPEGYLEQVFFLGDSTTYGMRIYKIFGDKNTPRVWSPKSGTLALFNATREKLYDPADKMELSLSEMAAKYRPPYLVITLGVNGISMMKESYFKSEYAKVIALVREASPETKIILQSMYPVSSAYHETKSLNQEKIILGNGWIHDVAAENGCRFLNSYAWFLDENGYMDLQYENGGDGMHFNAAGYRRMLDFLLTHPYPESDKTAGST